MCVATTNGNCKCLLVIRVSLILTNRTESRETEGKCSHALLSGLVSKLESFRCPDDPQLLKMTATLATVCKPAIVSIKEFHNIEKNSSYSLNLLATLLYTCTNYFNTGNGHRMHNCFEVAAEIKKSTGFKSEERAGQTVGLARLHCKAVACH